MKCKPKKIIIYIILIILTLIYILPFLWMINVSLKTNQELMTNPFSMPEVLQLGNYIYAWVNGNLGIAMLNSFIVCSVSLILSLTIGSMAAFAIARMKWKLSEWTLSYFLFGMMIPVHCVLIPLFVQFSKLGLTDSLIGLIIPYTVFALPMVIFLMTGFFKSLQNEIFEAACIDGCSIYSCFFKIAAPLTKTGFSVAGMMIFVSSWNEYTHGNTACRTHIVFLEADTLAEFRYQNNLFLVISCLNFNQFIIIAERNGSKTRFSDVLVLFERRLLHQSLFRCHK